jgi:hypothetical protein
MTSSVARPAGPKSLKMLLTEASSTSARQALYALGQLGYTVDVCDPNPLCLGRFSRYVRRWYRCPPFGAEPEGYLKFLIKRLKRGRYDVLLPVHDQIYLLARFGDLLREHTSVALPPVTALEQVQNKAEFVLLMDQLSLPHPSTAVVRGVGALRRTRDFPCYVKLAYGTAGTCVWLVRNPVELEQLALQLQAGGAEKEHDILVQQPADGIFGVTQSVFRDGELVAAHSYQARALGVGGSARCRESASHPIVERHLAQLGAALRWHGALHIEYFYDTPREQPMYIDANPRIGETFNATLSGTNLCDLLVQISLGRSIDRQRASRAGVRTHSLLTSLLAAAETGPGRKNLLRELQQACAQSGLYDKSQEELTRGSDDWMSVIPLVVVLLRLLVAPGTARGMVQDTVDNYSLNAAAVDRIRNWLRLNSEVGNVKSEI